MPRRWLECVFVLLAGGERGEAGFVRELRATDRLAERGPLLVVAHGDGDPAVVACAAEGVVRRGVTRAVAAQLRRRAGGARFEQGAAEEVDRALRLRELDELALAGALAMVQRGEDGAGRLVWDRKVGVQGRDAGGWPAGQAHARVHAGVGDHAVAVGPVAAVRAARAHDGHRQHHEVRPDLPQILVAEPLAVHAVAGEVVRDHVALGDQLLCQFDASRRVEVDLD